MLSQHLDKWGYDPPMTASEIRRRNAQKLAEESGGPNAFALKMDMSTSYCSQIIGRSPVRNIGPTLARRIEAVFGKEEGWLDSPHWVQKADEAKPMNGDIAEIAKAWSRLSATQRAYYREMIFRDAAIAAVAPWFKTGTPDSPRYMDFEKGARDDMEAKMRQLSLFPRSAGS